MSTVVIDPPEPLVSLALAKQHLRVDGDDQDTLIEAYIAAASQHIDGPAGFLGRAIAPQTLEDRRVSFWTHGATAVRLEYEPVIDIVSVTYVDGAGADQVLAPADYLLTGEFGAPLLSPAYGVSWPAPRYAAESVRVRYRAGYVEDATADPLVAAVPKPIEAAALLHIQILCDQPEEPQRKALEDARDALLNPYRRRRV
jgi:uncharacterized phiE125 gp8 family phage protein